MAGFYRSDTAPDLLYEVWAYAMRDVTDEQLALGWKNCIDRHESDFMPAPGRFRLWCLPEAEFGDELPELQ